MAQEPVEVPVDPTDHRPTEWMIANGYADFATPEDLKGLDEAQLVELAGLCPAPELAPLECIPCFAYAEVEERRKERDKQAQDDDANPELAAHIQESLAKAMDAPMPLLDRLVSESSPFRPDKPVVERFADQVGVLQELVSEMLSGPPIPPRDVSLDELAALVVGAERWLAMTDAQGLELTGPPKEQRDLIASVVQKVKGIHG